MPFIGNTPSAVPLTSADIADSIITSAKIVDATIANADIANSTINLTTKVTGTLPVANGGTGLAALGTSLQVLRTNSGATALEFATPTSATNTPNFFAYRSTSTFSVPNAVATTFIFNSENFDTASAYNTTTGQFTVPSGQAGKYLLMSQLYMDTDADRFILIMKKNGTDLIYSDANASSSTPVANLVSAIVSLSVADVIRVDCFQNQGAAVSFASTTNGNLNYFCGMKIIE